MSFVAPGILALGAIAIAALAALHLLARRRPRAAALPTARFVPERATRLLSRTLAPTDPWLLLLRALAVVALVLAFAQPVMARRHARIARVVLIDRSRDVASIAELRDSVRALARSAAMVIAFDTAATRLKTPVDSLALSGARGSLSAGLVAAIRAGADAARAADSVELVVVSPLVARESDAATAAIAATWPGRIRVVRVAARAADTTSHPIEHRAPAGDAVAAALSLGTRSTSLVRLVRDAATAGDSTWLGTAPGRVLVVWPARGLEAGSVLRPSAVTAGAATVVAPFGVARPPTSGRVVARWADGSPAATERSLGAGCVRDVAIPIEQRSDLTLRPPFRALLAALVAPCGESAPITGGIGDPAAVFARRVDRLASGRELAAGASDRGAVVPLLLGIGLFLLVVEWIARRALAGGARTRSTEHDAVRVARERTA